VIEFSAHYYFHGFQVPIVPAHIGQQESLHPVAGKQSDSLVGSRTKLINISIGWEPKEIFTNAYLVCMIEQGKQIELNILKRAGFGLYLSDDSGEEVLLPNKYCTEEMKPGGKVKVFIYRDSEGRKVATTQAPKIYLHEFALLKVTALTVVGAFLDWGLDKDLMVPFREQKQKMEEGRWYIVYLELDQKTDRLFASNRVERYLQNEKLTVKEGEEVALVVQQKTDLGYAVIINHAHKGLIFDNEVFKEIRIGDTLEGFVKKVRDDQKIDVSLQPLGFRDANDANSELICKQLEENDGFLPFTDKSTPEEISTQFGISKKAFKKSLGDLYKQRKIEIQPGGIKLF
jgi:predicted RNA-binding protein (virulence factor B family)